MAGILQAGLGGAARPTAGGSRTPGTRELSVREEEALSLTARVHACPGGYPDWCHEGHRGQVASAAAGGVQDAHQGEGPAAHGFVPPERWLVEVLGGEHALQAAGFGRDATLPPGLAQQIAQLLDGRRGGGRPGRGRCQDGAGFRARDAAAAAPERAQQRGVVLAQ
jgi:hypothetical protein